MNRYACNAHLLEDRVDDLQGGVGDGGHALRAEAFEVEIAIEGAPEQDALASLSTDSSQPKAIDLMVKGDLPLALAHSYGMS
jgi:hypothetical protein